jgi:hypothetical protein
MLATWHFHLEISSKCTLRCPWCSRQEVSDRLLSYKHFVGKNAKPNARAHWLTKIMPLPGKYHNYNTKVTSQE